jgi:phosphatidylglycerophosphatase A
LRSDIQYKIATLGFIGFLPNAPGTFSSAAGFLLMLLLKPDDLFLLLILIPLFFVGTVTATTAEKILGKDSGHIVIDEFYGYMISVLFVPKSFGYLIAALVLFRVFDIVKPPPVKEMEELFTGGAGIMLDDVLAGVLANLCIQAWRYLF